MKNRTLIGICAVLCAVTVAPSAQAQSLRFSGFGDFVFGSVSGGPADPVALARYLSAVSVGMGVMASSGADREALRQVAAVSVEAIEQQSTKS